MPVVQQDQSDEVLRSIGQELCRARMARGEDLVDVAAFLRIRPAYLTALEEGDIGAIPGRPYAVGFLRGYGDYLGLDGKALVARLKAAVRDVTAPPDLSYREPLSESRRPTVALVTASLTLATALYAGYYVLSVDRPGAPERVAQAPGELGELARSVLASRDPGPSEPPVLLAAPAENVAAAAAPTSQAAAAPAVSTTTPQPAASAAAPSATADVTSAVAAESNDATRAGAVPMVLAALDSERPAPAAPAAAVAQDGRVVILAHDSSWVQVRSAGRDYVRTRTLQAGERFALPDRTDLALWTGNAGGLEILVDGQSLGRAGETGAVLKNLPLGPDSLKQRMAAAAR
jgi:cytoskeleton protein RodZ